MSIHRFLQYVNNPDYIKPEELSTFRKEWMQAVLDLVPDHLLTDFAAEVRMLFQDIFANYNSAMKFAIVEYVLRSPDERKRLHILMLP